MKILPVSDLPVINGERVSLRPITDADTDNIVKWRNNPDVYRYFIFREWFTPEMHRSWLSTRVLTGQVVQYIILAGEERRAVGSVYLRDIDHKHESAEYGIFIGDDSFRGQGVGTETAKLFTDFALDVLGVHRVFLKVLDGNVKARRSYEKAGFVYEGTFRDMVKLDGEFHDVVFMAKINGGSENE